MTRIEGKMNKILLVEDNPDDVDLTMIALGKNSIAGDVAVAHDGIEALEYLNGTGKFAGRDHTLLPKVIMLDLKMPRMDGLEFLRHIRADERTRLLPVVVFTTSNEERDKIESYKLGANSYLTKPVDYKKFVDTIQQLASYWLVLNQAAIDDISAKGISS
jgi:CheY-like chemotaxis protein